MATALVSFVMVHPTAATCVKNYGTSGDAAKIVAGKKVYKYGETCDELGYDLIPFAIETYGKFGKAALKHLKVLQTMALLQSAWAGGALAIADVANATPWPPLLKFFDIGRARCARPRICTVLAGFLSGRR
jgi:hypothetical protein